MRKEQHTMSDYCYDITMSSKYVPDKIIPAVTVFRCPVCENERPRPEHGEEWQCVCGMNYITHGNGLEMWKGCCCGQHK